MRACFAIDRRTGSRGRCYDGGDYSARTSDACRRDKREGQLEFFVKIKSFPPPRQPDTNYRLFFSSFTFRIQILGAHRANVTKVILPQANLKDVEHDVPREVRDAMDLVFVRTVEEALDAAFGKGVLMWKRGARNGSMHVESRL